MTLINSTKEHTHTYTLTHRKPRLREMAWFSRLLYDIRPGNGAVLFLTLAGSKRQTGMSSHATDLSFNFRCPAISISDVNKAKFSRPRPPEVNKGTSQI